MSYRVVLARSVQKELDRLPAEVVERVLSHLETLEANPRPTGVKKLRGRPAYRLRSGDYRIIYEIHDRELRVLVITVGHRRDIYR
jgi:mRNA interferase RelE/StbE